MHYLYRGLVLMASLTLCGCSALFASEVVEVEGPARLHRHRDGTLHVILPYRMHGMTGDGDKVLSLAPLQPFDLRYEDWIQISASPQLGNVPAAFLRDFNPRAGIESVELGVKSPVDGLVRLTCDTVEIKVRNERYNPPTYVHEDQVLNTKPAWRYRDYRLNGRYPLAIGSPELARSLRCEGGG